MHQGTPTPTPAERQRILQRIADGLGIPSDLLTVKVPYQADRYARPGELCICRHQAIVIYEGTKYGDLGFCGGRHG